MCGIAAVIDALGSRNNESLLSLLEAMISIQRHRGPDAQGKYIAPFGSVALGHTRLSIIDLSEHGTQPMSDVSGRYWLVFNGEVYNYLELQQELRSTYSFRTRTDTEVVLASYLKWGPACLDRLIGMFAFIVWDEQTHELFAARDRFGVKPLYYHYKTGRELLLASEIKALHAAGVPASPDAISWATYLTHGICDHSDRSFWAGIHSLPPGHALTWRDRNLQIRCWYDLPERVGDDEDTRPIEKVEEEYSDLLVENVSLRFRSDVPVGINLSGGWTRQRSWASSKRSRGSKAMSKPSRLLPAMFATTSFPGCARCSRALATQASFVHFGRKKFRRLLSLCRPIRMSLLVACRRLPMLVFSSELEPKV
jgi:asparagine synthase (glutamine-hydrolysing)